VFGAVHLFAIAVTKPQSFPVVVVQFKLSEPKIPSRYVYLYCFSVWASYWISLLVILLFYSWSVLANYSSGRFFVVVFVQSDILSSVGRLSLLCHFQIFLVFFFFTSVCYLHVDSVESTPPEGYCR